MTDEGPGASPERRDLVVTEAFHRLKRTVLLFSAILVVIALGTPKATGTLHMTLADLDLPMGMARWLLWGAAAYYVVGFYLEVRVCIRLNSNVLSRSSARSYEAAVAEISSQLGAHAKAFEDEVPKILANLRGLASNLSGAVGRLEAGPHSMVGIFQSGDREGSYMFYRTASPEQIQQREDAIAFRAAASSLEAARKEFEGVTSALELHQPVVERLADEAREASRKADKAHRDLSKLNDLVLAERQWSFWAWEIGGVAIAFVAATLALPYPATQIAGWLASA